MGDDGASAGPAYQTPASVDEGQTLPTEGEAERTDPVPVATAATDKQGDGPPTPWYNPSDNRGNLKYVNCTTRCPCLSMAIVYAVVLVSCILLSRTMAGKGLEDIISQGDIEYDANDIRSIKYDSLQLAVDDVSSTRQDSEDAAKPEVVDKPMSKSLDILMMLYETPETIFTTQSAEALKKVEDLIVEHPEFPDWCKRTYAGENDTKGECDTYKTPLDLSPIKFLYASEFDSKKAKEVVEKLKKPPVLAAAKKMGRCLDPGITLRMPVNPSSCDPDNEIPEEHRNDAKGALQDIHAIMLKFDGSAEKPVEDLETMSELVAWLKELPTRGMFVDFVVDKNYNVSNPKSKWVRSLISFGGPLKDKDEDGTALYTNVTRDSRTPQRDKLKDWILCEKTSDCKAPGVYEQLTKASKNSFADGINLIYFMTTLLFDVLILLLAQDGLLAVFSVVVIFLYIWVTTGSVFLALVGMSEIVLSLPLAWFVLRLIGVNYFGFLNAVCIFIVCAIGADDIFVFMDAYVQSAYKGPEVNRDLATRMSWVYRKAGLAMLITSTTTCAAFLCCLTTPIVSTQGFGIYASLVIAADYILVMTLFCTAVVIYHNCFERPPACGCKLPCPLGKCSCGFCCENCDCSMTEPSPTQRALMSSHDAAHAADPDVVEQFFRTKFAPMILNPRNRLIIAAVALAWIIPAVIFVFKLKPMTATEQFLREDHPLQRAIDVLNTEFGASSEDRGIDVFYTWGLQNLDRSNVNFLVNMTNKGKPVFDPNFKLTSECMDKIREVCDDFRLTSSTEYLGLVQRKKNGEGSIKCFVYEMDYIKQNMDAPTGWNSRVKEGCSPGKEGCDSKVGSKWDTSSPEKIELVMNDFLVHRAMQDPDAPDTIQTIEGKYNEMIGWNGEKMKFVGVALESRNLTLYNRPAEPVTRSNYEAYDKLRTKIDEVAAEACGCKVQMTDQVQKFITMNNQMIYRTSAVRGAVIGVVIAFFVLLVATWNLTIAVLSTLSILCSMMSVIGMMTMINGEESLGTTFAILISILAGFSVDYTVHLAHAFAHSHGTCEQRVIHAFSEMGSPVLSGMITSVLASLPLFLCNLVFFSQFGTFLCLTILFSWLFANFCFMAAVATLGGDSKTTPVEYSNKTYPEPTGPGLVKEGELEPAAAS